MHVYSRTRYDNGETRIKNLRHAADLKCATIFSSKLRHGPVNRSYVKDVMLATDAATDTLTNVGYNVAMPKLRLTGKRIMYNGGMMVEHLGSGRSAIACIIQFTSATLGYPNFPADSRSRELLGWCAARVKTWWWRYTLRLFPHIRTRSAILSAYPTFCGRTALEIGVVSYALSFYQILGGQPLASQRCLLQASSCVKG